MDELNCIYILTNDLDRNRSIFTKMLKFHTKKKPQKNNGELFPCFALLCSVYLPIYICMYIWCDFSKNKSYMLKCHNLYTFSIMLH